MTEGWGDDDSRAFIACGALFGGCVPAYDAVFGGCKPAS